MTYLKKGQWPDGAVQCAGCATGYVLPPHQLCYLCNHPEKRQPYSMDEQEDADFGHALGLDWGRD